MKYATSVPQQRSVYLLRDPKETRSNQAVGWLRPQEGIKEEVTPKMSSTGWGGTQGMAHIE